MLEQKIFAPFWEGREGKDSCFLISECLQALALYVLLNIHYCYC